VTVPPLNHGSSGPGNEGTTPALGDAHARELLKITAEDTVKGVCG
jgi:hypothetical protein